MWISIRRATGTLVVTALCATPLLAQQPADAPRPADAKIKKPAPPATDAAPAAPAIRTPAGERAVERTVNKPVIANQSPAQVDQMIAGMLALCNEAEATVGKFASQHAQHGDVKKFAEMMAKDHSQMATQLQKWAPDATLTKNANRASDKLSTGAANTAMPFDPLQVHQQIASRSIASAEKSLGSKKGADFDMAYIGSQCVLHQQMIDKASVLRQYASPDLRAELDKGLEVAENHLDRAHELIDKLAKAEKTSK